jgi:PD-(D/E)XK nuclease superfamily protein
LLAVNDAQLLAAISSTCEVVRQQRARDRSAEQRRVALVRAAAERVKALYGEELSTLKARIDACLLPVEPLRLAWNVFRLFDLEHEETRWTQWFAAILRPENGERCSRVAWGAFCAAVAHRAEILSPSGDSNPADQHHWRDIVSEEVPKVEDEVSDGDLGTLDLLFTTSSIVAAVENKLWADWHDGAKAPQADRYRDLAKKRLVGDDHRRLGLVLLSQRRGLKPGDYPSDYIHVSWRDVGWALRDALRREWSDDQRSVIELWPIVLTLVSIEQDLLGLSLTSSATSNRSTILKRFFELATYLEGR